eukprot:jgi/Psemu1/186523/e_gw1.59.109.1
MSQRSFSANKNETNTIYTSGIVAPTPHNIDDSNWPVRSVEGILRNVVILCGAYTMGAFHPEWSSTVLRMLEFILTAWGTCLVILGLGWMRKLKNRQAPRQEYLPQLFVDQEQPEQRIEHFQENIASEITPLLQDQEDNDSSSVSDIDVTERVSNTTEDDEHNGTVAEPSISDDVAIETKQSRHEIEHPKLASFYVVDSSTGRRVSCNSSTPFRISNEWMEMEMLVMLRTPDVDDSDAIRGTTANDKVSHYMKNKQRRFEFQYQVKLKKAPVGKRIYFSCELDEPIKMGIVTKAFVSAAMAFVKSTNPSFHYNITGSKKKTSDGKYETPHMSFTIEGSVDRFVVTKPGEKPPQLGTAIHEDPELMKKRKSGTMINFNTEDTYTLSLWSSYVDFLDWKCLNLPGIKPFGLSSVLGTQSINLTMYFIDENREGDNHYRKDISEIIKFEFSNGKMAATGKEAQKWISAEEQRQMQLKSNSVLSATKQEIDEPPKRRMSEDSGAAMGIPHDDSEEFDGIRISETNDEAEEIDRDTEDAAELGEGIYLKSGDSVLIREFLPENEKSTASTVINSGGFAVFSTQYTPIVIEKTKWNRKSKLIKSGDTVKFKMIQKKAQSDALETRYLTIHRGWWLKWVTTMPSKNGNFTIYTHETELGERALPTDETQSSFLTLGGSFTLRHKRWSKYGVGISSKPSTDFGGRMLSLYNVKTNKGAVIEEDRNQAIDQSEDELDSDREMPSIEESGRVKPLVLCTQDPQTMIEISPKSPIKASHFDHTIKEKFEPQTPNGFKLIFSSEHSGVDVPAWIEMLDRVQRVRQLAYVVRVVYRNPSGDGTERNNEETFVRLKSGKKLAHIMSIGQSIEIPNLAPRSLSNMDCCDSVEFNSNANNGINQLYPFEQFSGSNHSDEGEEGLFGKKFVSSGSLIEYDSYGDSGHDVCEPLASVKMENSDSMNDDGVIEDSMSDSSSSDTDAESKSKRRLGNVKRLAKKTVVGTGTGKATGKVVKTTGKILIAPVALKTGKQPRLESKKRKKKSQSRLSKTMKKLGKIEAKSGGPPTFVAGELSATEQSRRTASRVLERMSNVPIDTSVWQSCNDALSSEIGFITEQDTWFLNGDAMQLGVKPSKKHGKLLDESIVARCLYESHWREEWCGIYESCLVFYAPLAKSKCHEIYFCDITLVRPLVEGRLNPLPGFSILVVETAWQCHYLAFHDERSRNVFYENTESAVLSLKKRKENESLEQSELQRARFWQGFQTLSESSLSTCAAKWAKVSSQQKLKERAILNGRRMSFDGLTLSFGNSISKVNKFVEDLLTMALTFSLNSLEQDPESFIKFLDLTSELRFLPLEEIDRSSPYAFCLFVNIYHCLLQQALLLSVNGPLHKKNVSHFMRTSCYEIGGDVFSLAELHSCVICGNMSKPINPKPPYIEAPKKSNAHKYYALDYIDARVHFVLNTADMACPASVPVFSRRYVEQQLNTASVDFFANNQLVVDTKRRIITIPKVCEIHRTDFGNGELINILKICVDEMENDLGNAIREVVERKGEKGLTIRFQHAHEQYHSSLKLRTTAMDQNVEMDYYCIQSLESNSIEE